MSALNAISCLNNTGNTGNPKCFFDPAFISGAVLAPTGSVIDPALNGGNLLTTMSALWYNASPAARLYPLYDFEKPTDSSDKLVLQSMPNGAKHPVREGFNDWMFQYFDGGLTAHLNKRQFNGTNWDFFFLSTDLQTGLQQLIGIYDTTGTKLMAMPCSPGGFFWAHPWSMNSGTERSNYSCQFSFSQRYMNTKGLSGFLNMVNTSGVGFTLESSLPGLNDATLVAFSPISVVPKHFYVSIINQSSVDIGAIYSLILGAGVSSATYWRGFASATPNLAYTITSATWIPGVGSAAGYFDILVGATNYATPPATSVINLAVPATLVAAGIAYESTGGVTIASV